MGVHRQWFPIVPPSENILLENRIIDTLKIIDILVRLYTSIYLFIDVILLTDVSQMQKKKDWQDKGNKASKLLQKHYPCTCTLHKDGQVNDMQGQYPAY